jgi:hypothetical protein
MAECCPKQPINNLDDYINYLKNRGYTIDKIEYYPNYILGIPEYDVYFPEYIHMKYKTGNELIIVTNAPENDVFSIDIPYNEYKFIDVGASVNNRRYKFSDITEFNINFLYYPENVGNYKTNIYGAYYPWEMSVIMLDYFEDPVLYTKRYMEKCQNMINYINNDILPIINNKGYDYEVTSFNSSNGVYVMKDHEWGKNIFDITLHSQKTDNRICFSLSKLSLSPKLFVSNHVDVMTKCRRLEDVFVDDLTTDEIIELIDTCNDINNSNPEKYVYSEKARILKLYTNIKNDPNNKNLLTMKTVDDMPKLCNAYINDPEIGQFAVEILKWIKKNIPKITHKTVIKK